jgi:hypothetical protein
MEYILTYPGCITTSLGEGTYSSTCAASLRELPTKNGRMCSGYSGHSEHSEHSGYSGYSEHSEHSEHSEFNTSTVSSVRVQYEYEYSEYKFE